MNTADCLYSLDNLNQIYDSDRTIITQIIAVFIENVPKYSADLDAAVSGSNWSALSFTAHKLKSTIKLFRINTALDDIVAIELDAKSLVNLESLPRKVQNVISILHQAEQQLRGNEMS